MANRQAPWLLVLVPVLGLLLGYGLRVTTRQTHGATPAGEPGPEAAALLRPEFELAALEGPRVSSQDLRGKVVLIEFWATWCGPCRTQAEILEPVFEEHREAVTFLAVNLGEAEATVRDHLAYEPLPYPVLLDRAEVLGSALGIYALPSVAVLDREGRVAYLHQGLTASSVLRREIGKALAAPDRRAAAT